MAATEPSSGPKRAFFDPISGGWLLVAAHFAAHADRILPAIVAPTIKARFDLSDRELGLLLGPAFVLAFVAASLGAGAFVGWVRRYRLIAFGLVVWSLATVGFGLAQNLEQLAAARAVLGLGQAVLAPAALSLILQQAPPDRAGRAVAGFTSGATIGRSTALLLGGALLTGLSLTSGLGGLSTPTPAWRALFIIGVLPNLLLAALLLRRREPPGAPRNEAKADGLGAWLRRTPLALGLHLTLSSAAILLTQSVAVWAPSVFVRSAGITPGTAALWTGVVVLAAAPLGHMTGGLLVDRARKAGRPPTTPLAAVFLLVVPAAAGLGWAQGLLPLAAAYFVLTVVVGAAAVAALAGYQPLVPPKLRGEGNAIYFAVVSLVGLGLGPPLVGAVSDRLGAGPRDLLLALAATTAAVALPAAAASLASAAGWMKAASKATEQ